MESTRPCLFYEDEKEPQKTAEHILQKGLGTSWTLTEDVCHGCNTREFSARDGELVRFARRLNWNHPAIGGRFPFGNDLCLQFDPFAEAWITVRLDATATPIVFPQLIFMRTGQPVLIVQPESSPAKSRPLLEVIREELMGMHRLKVSTRAVPRPDADLAPLRPALIRSAPGVYVAQADHLDTAEQLAEFARAGKLSSQPLPDALPPARSLEPGEVHTRLHVNIKIGDVYRAAAKSAVNLLCAVVGPEIARHPAFDPVKQYVLQGDPEGDEGGGFVHGLWGMERQSDFVSALERGIAKPELHTLFLAKAAERPGVFFFLYGKPFAFVWLTKAALPSNLIPKLETLALFDFATKTHVVAAYRDSPLYCARPATR